MPERRAAGLMRALGEEIGIPGLALDDAGCCSLDFDGTVVNFELAAASRQLFLYANIGEISAAAGAGLYQRLLDANLLWKGTAGATLALDQSGNRVVMQQAVAVEHVSDADFKAMVEAYVAVAEEWAKRVEEAAAEFVPRRDAALSPMLINLTMLA